MSWNPGLAKGLTPPFSTLGSVRLFLGGGGEAGYRSLGLGAVKVRPSARAPSTTGRAVLTASSREPSLFFPSPAEASWGNTSQAADLQDTVSGAQGRTPVPLRGSALGLCDHGG